MLLIKEVRQSKGLTQVELATKAGLSAATITNYENGKRSPKLKDLEKIAKALGLDICELFLS